MQLYGYFRSSASYRVRIALALKGLSVTQVSKHLRLGEQLADDFRKLNPQAMVPVLVTDNGENLTQSLAIIEWLEETHPQPRLLPADPLQRARIRAFALSIACEIHPLQNLRVLKNLGSHGLDESARNQWAHDVNAQGLTNCETMLQGATTPFCFGNAPSLADICLVPQMFNARRFGVDTRKFVRLHAIEAQCLALDAFQSSAPERQADAE
ncbi:MAG: maleylacetoacetate isomerase [Hyphomicrobiales bacterium]|nr:maleylacetoacetate isomerase [Hyphomicrobiales bacterium]MDE2114999.1 maleylacetoacetate isomerase [Hyphomicrobiales bacterium]